MTLYFQPIVMQCSKFPIPDNIITRTMKSFPGWGHQHFDDDSMCQYIVDNPIDEFSNSLEILKYFIVGPHKVDFFRYYYLYINGGIYIDSDLIIEENILSDIDRYDIITVVNNEMRGMFQGLLFCGRGNEMIHEALSNMYKLNINNNILADDYHAVCKDLYKIIGRDTEYTRKIYNEKYARIINDDETHSDVALIRKRDQFIGIHYFDSKKISELSIPEIIEKRIIKWYE